METIKKEERVGELEKAEEKERCQGFIIASTKGTEEAPGRNVREKSGLYKSVLEQGWFEFRRQLDYKIVRMEGRLEQKGDRHTSQRCSKCGHTEKGNRKSQAEFVCLFC